MNYQLFDALPDHIEDALRASIKRFGVMVPIVRDQHGTTIDGHHRARIADELRIDYRIDVVRVENEEQAREIARHLNSRRRHLSGEQLREHIVMLAERTTPTGVGELSNNEIAQIAGVDRRYVDRTLNAAEHGSTPMLPETRRGADGKVRPAKRQPAAPGPEPEPSDELPAAEEPVEEETAESRRPTWISAKNDRDAAKAGRALSDLGEAPAPDTMTSNEAVRLAARQRQPEPIAEPVPVPDGKHQCVVIDPPWPIQKIEREERPNQGEALDYPTLPIECQTPNIDRGSTPCFENLCDCSEPCGDDNHPNEPCRSIECVVGQVLTESTHDNCHLYLWVTQKYLPAGLRLLESWGFTYQCVMTWRKNVGITPYSWMYDTEHVLFARKGNLKLTTLGLRLSFDAPAQGHSIKPDVFYDRVRQASPGPRLDMFPGVEHDNFIPWGLEATHRDTV